MAYTEEDVINALRAGDLDEGDLESAGIEEDMGIMGPLGALAGGMLGGVAGSKLMGKVPGGRLGEALSGPSPMRGAERGVPLGDDLYRAGGAVGGATVGGVGAGMAGGPSFDEFSIMEALASPDTPPELKKKLLTALQSAKAVSDQDSVMPELAGGLLGGIAGGYGGAKLATKAGTPFSTGQFYTGSLGGNLGGGVAGVAAAQGVEDYARGNPRFQDPLAM